MPEFFAPAGSQLDLVATSLTDLYTCPVNKTARVTVTFCNRAATATAIRLAVGRAGEADDVKQYLLYDVALAANETQIISEITINETDVVRVVAADSGVSASLLVDEIRELAP